MQNPSFRSITWLQGMNESQYVCTHHTTTLPSPFYMMDGLTSLASVSVSFGPSSAHTPNPVLHCFYPVFLGLRGNYWGSGYAGEAAGASSSICCASSVMSCMHPPTHSHLSLYPIVLPVYHASHSITASPAPVAHSYPSSSFLGSRLLARRLVHHPLSHPALFQN